MNRVMTLALTALLTIWSSVFAVEIETVEPDTGTLGTTLTITGTDFGAKKPKVVLTQVVSGKTVKISPKITGFSNTELTVVIGSAKVTGSYDLTITVKGQEPAVLEDAFAVMAPEVDEVDPASGSPEREVTILGAYFDLKPQVVIGGQKAKVIGRTEEELTVLVPKKLANGFYDVTVKTKVGTATLPSGFKVTGSTVGIPKNKVLTWKVNGKSFAVKNQAALNGAYEPVTNILVFMGAITTASIGSKFYTLNVAAILDLDTDGPWQVGSSNPLHGSLIAFTEAKLVFPPADPGTKAWNTEDSGNWSIVVSDWSPPRISGTFSGTLVNPNPPFDTIQITDGIFSLDLAYTGD